MKIEWVFDPAGHSMTKFRDMEEGIVQPTSTMSKQRILPFRKRAKSCGPSCRPNKADLYAPMKLESFQAQDKKNFYAARICTLDCCTPRTSTGSD